MPPVPQRQAKVKLRPSELVIILDDLDFSWFPYEIQKVAERFNAGVSFEELVDWTGRDPDEVLMLLIHLRRQGKVSFENTGFVWKEDKANGSTHLPHM